MTNEKIILDTDIGDDIDDAFALAVAVKSPQVQLLGVTTVFKNTLARAKQASQMLEVLGAADVPVFAGSGKPLVGEIPAFAKDQGDLLAILPCQYDESMSGCKVQKEVAADAIIRLANENPGELTVVTIGAATNLALALQKEKTLAGKIKRVVSMCGSFNVYRPEWNVLCDAEAMSQVFASGIPVYCVGLDVTLQCGLEPDLLQSFRTSPLPHNKLLSTWLSRWFDYFNFEKSVMHDPLALCAVFDPDVCHFSKQFVRVVTQGGQRGAIAVSPTPKEDHVPVFVADGVNRERFYQTLQNLLLR